jgi:hypothetical protein
MPARSYMQTRIVFATSGCTQLLHDAGQLPHPASITTDVDQLTRRGIGPHVGGFRCRFVDRPNQSENCVSSALSGYNMHNLKSLT